MTPSDPRYYYLANFERALAWIAQRYDDLLSPEETDFLRDFAALPLASRALLVRMLMRRGDRFRTSRLIYDEIGDTPSALGALAALGWIDTHPSIALESLFHLLTRPELVEIFGKSMTSGARKADWLAQLATTHMEARSYAAWWPDAPDTIVDVTIASLCERFRLMFFGNLYQEWSEFVLADLGIFRYELVAFDASSRAFRQRADIDTYLLIQQCRAMLDPGSDVDLNELLDVLDAATTDNPWLETRRAKVLFQTGQYCERLHDWETAIRVYQRTRYPGARHRLIRVLERCERFGHAWPLALEAIANPESDEEHQRVVRMVPRLKRHVSKSLTQDAQCTDAQRMTAIDIAEPDAGLPSLPARTTVDRIDVVLARPTIAVNVEQVALDYLTRDDAPVHYVENTLLNSLFGLLCWPAIFEAVPGAFFHPFQSGPADLHSPDFHQRRAASFEACFSELDAGPYRSTIVERFERKFGLQSPFVSWGVLTPELLALALECIPAAHLRRCFERLLSNIKANRSGLPDLIQFWPAERRYAWIEVKGPGDRLQDNQLRWIDYCAQHGIPVRVLHIQWSDERADVDEGRVA